MQDNAVVPFFFCDEQVRTVTLDDGIWFIVSDVCNILGLKNGGRNARTVLRDERTCYYPISSYFVRRGKTVNTTVKMLLTDESGVYRLVLRSYKPDAMRFQHWITSEVLPSLRERGSYTMTEKPEQEQLVAGAYLPVRPHTMTLTAGTMKLSAVISFSTDGGITGQEMYELYRMADELLGKVTRLSL